MRESFLIFGSPTIGDAEIAEVVDSLRSGWIGTGSKVHRFEGMLSEYIGARHTRCLASCTAALTLSLMVLDVGPGDEVLVPAMTFVASANAVEHTGATPVLVDSEPGHGLIDLDAAEAAITPRTKAVMPVHLAGRPVDMDRLGRLRERHGLHVIEDAAHAIGAEWGGRRIGAWGNLTAFSFYATKNITTIEGGAVVTESAPLAERVEQLALHGLSAGAWQRFTDRGFRHYEAVEPGFKFNMTDIQAALGVIQLPQLDGWIQRRRELWERYDELLQGLPLDTPPPPAPGTRHARHLYQVRLTGHSPLGRDELIQALHDRNIGTGVHYRGVHLHPYYRRSYGLSPDDFPVATRLSERTISLPLGPGLKEADQDDVVQALTRLLRPRLTVVAGPRSTSPS
ncbi:MAG TPA: DegT/DnrJ/EryC1/StrS aminotransferase family protein [Solirubrobacteraceae bacterium]|nr:DegT/DnrJ/EryC1/StrS aminotransferase family protein [Solirubrobacteraceae bacterium]